MNKTNMCQQKTVTLPVRATFTWSAPAKYHFEDCRVPRGLRGGALLMKIEEDAQGYLASHPSLEGLQDYYNLSGCIDVWVNGELVQEATGDDIDAEDGRRIELSVAIEGELEPNAGIKTLKSWDELEVLDELRDYADLEGDGSRFQVKARYVK